MIETNKCPGCKHVYEIVWDDDNSEYYNDNEDEDELDQFDESEELYPEYCPFCGIHRDYNGEVDSSDDELL
jgi:hypothetical protein